MNVLDRRDFLRSTALASAAAAASAVLPDVTFGDELHAELQEAVDWKKAPCRFCGTGCGLLVGILDGRAVGVRGDPDSPVNRGLACVKGYHSVQALYGRDRIRSAMVRRDGRLVPVPLAEALDLIADRLRDTVQEHGKDAVAMYGSGQWSIPDGYVATKLFKGGIGTNNLEASARLGMGSAVSGALTSFGLDEPMGCFDDIDHADVFVLWGNNMAETHPVLFSRMLERRRTDEDVRIIDLATRTTRTSYAADRSILFQPQTDLALANAICHEIVRSDWVDEAFVRDYVAFKAGRTGIPYGTEERVDFEDEAFDADWEKFVDFLDEYAPDEVSGLTGVPADEIRYLASIYADPARHVVSFWCQGVNQHTRGTWMNNLIYNIHLLVGKIAQPGNGPFSLSGQPSACGTVREVGTLTDALPGGGVVTDPEDRRRAAEIWQVPAERIPDQPTHDAVQMFRAFARGDIRFLWIQGANPMASLPSVARYRDGAHAEDRFVVVSDAYPTPTTDVADVVLPSAMWIEQEGLYGSSERRTQHWDQLLDPPGDCLGDGKQIVEVGRRLGYGDLFPWPEEGWVAAIWEEYGRFHDDPRRRLAPYEALRTRPGVLWPYVEGRETKWRYNPTYDPAATEDRRFDFYGKPDHRAWIWLRPHEPPPEQPDEEYPYWLTTGRVLEHWNTGSLSRRVPVLHQAMPGAYVELNREDAADLDVRDRDSVRLVTRRGTLVLPARIGFRGQPARGQVFVPFFDEGYRVNELTLDAFCPISRQPDYRKCAARIEVPGREQRP